jgi:hypothetical protein
MSFYGKIPIKFKIYPTIDAASKTEVPEFTLRFPDAYTTWSLSYMYDIYLQVLIIKDSG